MIPLDHLPEIGDPLLIQTAGQWVPAAVISMAECHKLQPNLWTDAYGKVWPEKAAPYGPDDTIRAYKFADGAGFCIMRFGLPGRYEYNKNVCKGALPTPHMPSYEERMAVIKEDGPFL